MLTLPVPVAVVIATCHLAVAATFVISGAPWVAVFAVTSVLTAALFLRRCRTEDEGYVIGNT